MMWHPRLLDVIAAPHEPRERFTVHGSVFAAPFDIRPVRWQMSWDETRAPHYQLRMDVAELDDVALSTAFDSRSRVVVHAHLGHVIDGRDDLVLVAKPGLRRRPRDLGRGVLALDFAGDEARMLDDAAARNDLTGATTTAAMVANIEKVIPSPEVVVATASNGPAVTIDDGDYTDKWSTHEELADRLGDVDGYHDGLVWWIVDRPVLAAEPVLTLRDGVGGTVMAAGSVTDREAFYNRVYLEYDWRDSGGTEHHIEAVASFTAGPYAAALGNVKTFHERRTIPTTQAKADTAAASILRRKASLGRTNTVRAVAVPWLRPRMTVALDAGDGFARHLVSSVLLDSAGWMEFTTRLPDSASTIGED